MGLVHGLLSPDLNAYRKNAEGPRATFNYPRAMLTAEAVTAHLMAPGLLKARYWRNRSSLRSCLQAFDPGTAKPSGLEGEAIETLPILDSSDNRCERLGCLGEHMERAQMHMTRELIGRNF